MNQRKRSLVHRILKRLTLVSAIVMLCQPLFAEERSAYDYMLSAHNARSVWENFPGFSADVVVTTDGESYHGTIKVASDFEYVLDIDDAARQPWVKSKLRSVISHRKPGEMARSGYAFLAQEDQHGSGKLIAQKDGSGVFRVVDGAILQVLRKSESQWLEITNLEQLKTPDGRLLPQVSSVAYRDPSTGNLLSNRTNSFAWTPVGEFLLPQRTFTVDVGEDGKRSLRELVFSNHKLQSESPSKAARSVLHKPLKESLTSFGAAVLGDYLYVFSGHNGDAHGFGRDALSDHFRRIKYDDPQAEWEELTKHEPAQSTALVSDGTYLYRIGGLTFLNRGEEETNFKSTDHFSRYDPAKNEWTELAPLPEPRSSLDAAILGRSIYVCAGWNLQGSSSEEAPWHEDILRFDLDKPESGWQSIEGPGYVTRAVSVAAHDGKLYLLGGIQQRGITRKVSVYDPQTSQWSEGPELKADTAAAGFATSSFSTGGQLYYTGGSGVLYRLSEDKSEWEVADRLLFPRMFLRLLPLAENRLIALGGTVSGLGRTASVESITLGPKKSTEQKIVSWATPFNGSAKHSQTLVLDGVQLFAVGGNASSSPHDFSKEAFVDEAFVFDISRQTVKQLPELPFAMQSGAGVLHSQNSEHQTILIAGGMGHRNGEFTSLDEVLRFDPETETWTLLDNKLPQERSMFAATVHDDAIWMFGGSQVGKERGLLASVLHWWGDESAIAAIPDTAVPTPRRSFGGARLKDHYYMVGGLTAENGIADDVDVFDFATRAWTQAPAPATPRVFPQLVTSGKQLFLYGGFTNTDGHFAPVTSLEVYDSESTSWRTVADEIAGVGPSMTMLEMNGRLLFYGIDGESKQANFVLFDPDPYAEPETVAGMSFGFGRNTNGDAQRNAKLMMRKDMNKDGKLSREELGQRMAEFFNKADANADDLLTLDEAVAALEAEAKSNSEDSGD